MTDVRVRFSPAPTGFLHVGGARTALFNWLFARHHGGEFLLRIEDTDVARSRQEWVDGIQHTLEWLGLHWDGEPVLQSTRFDRYLEAADHLVKAGRAYECFCTEDEVKARNEEALAAGRTPGYDGRCRSLDPARRASLAAEGRPRSIRFRTPDSGTSGFDDMVRGPVSVEWPTIHDFVIVRSNGTPVFFLANAVDDADMEISHVVRGEDLIDSTHRVLALREALGHAGRPKYAHLPLLVGADRGKLSKRHGAVALEDFRDSGYLPHALLNYLALLGWAPDDDREVMSIDEIVAVFDLDRVTHSPAFFDYQKLDWMNGEHIRRLQVHELAADVLPFARERYGERLDVRVFEAAVGLARERATTLVQIADQAEFLFVADGDLVVADTSWDRLVATERVREILDAVIAHLEKCEWTVEAIDLRPLLETLGLKARKALPAVYAAIEGSHAGLPLFDSIHLLGRGSAVARLTAARERLGPDR
ncbi:MAG: glutamate--tRNA ligase [Acidimicrobiia bacterium]|nr:glutamate--tRNA ligase [Acidimicrobiia bacterium]